MTISMYQASVPVFQRQLTALSNILGKAEAYVEARKIDPNALLLDRLCADMFTLTRQVQITCDQAKGGVARLAGVEVPTWEDKETTFADLKARISKTLDYIAGFSPEQIDGSEEREIVLQMRAGAMTFKGQAFLLGFSMPNFYFHMTTAYAILRHNGVDIGKRDFLGA